MRWRIYIPLMAAVFLLGTLSGPAHAQQVNIPPLGNMVGPGGAMVNINKPDPEMPSLNLNDTFVSFIDSAIPRSNFGLRYDGAYNIRQPMRATYLFARGGVPGGNGFPLPETRVDANEITSYAEYGISPWFSVFMEAPYRWINPEVNGSRHGAGDMRYGLKLCTWTDDNVLATILFRIYQPTARDATIGTGHWSIEPGLLVACRFNEKVHFEGEFRYWVPLTTDDFAGNILRYGVGLSYGQRNPMGFWCIPVAEGIGWTLLSGKTMLATGPDSFIINEAREDTIINAYLGLRLGYGPNLDCYMGYGRSLTGDFWARDMYRFELRFSF